MKKQAKVLILSIVFIVAVCAFTACACSPHKTHSFSETWSSDNTNHWHECSGCDEIEDKSAHIWDAGVVTKEATETETGIKTYTCSVCGKTKTETIPKLIHTHSFSDEWSSDNNDHWHKCSGCDEIEDKSAHTWDAGVVTKEATETETGIRTYTCSVCGKTKTGTIPSLSHTHSFSDEWSSDDNDHWYECSDCDEIKDKSAHTWDAGVVTKEATETETGIRTYTCSVCGKTKTETIPKTSEVLKLYTFEAECTDLSNKSGSGYSGGADESDMTQGGITKPSGTVTASGGRWVGFLYDEGCSVQYLIESDKDVTNATLILRLSVEFFDITISNENFDIRVDYDITEQDFEDYDEYWGDYLLDKKDGDAYVSLNNDISLKYPGNESDVSDFKDFTVSTNLNLKKGINMVSLVIANSTKPHPTLAGTMNATAPLVDCIKIITDATLTMHDAHNNGTPAAEYMPFWGVTYEG